MSCNVYSYTMKQKNNTISQLSARGSSSFRVILHTLPGSKRRITMKHTKGNWRSFTDNTNGFGVTNGNTVIAIAGETDLKENEANANLIAAAPELLQEYKNLVGRVSTMKKAMNRAGLNRWTKDWLGDGILNGEVIAKAEGK